MKRLLVLAFALLASCGGIDAQEPTTDAVLGPAIDSGVDSKGDCTVWGRVSTCPDGSIGCDRMICLSHDPQPCAWPRECPGVTP
jgi:hypothetical protein